jgi:plasmid maintenance system antidote protein VapI
MFRNLGREFSKKTKFQDKKIAVLGGGSDARRLSQELKKSAKVTLISKQRYVLDDFLKLTNAVGLSHFYELNLLKLVDQNLDVTIDEVEKVTKNLGDSPQFTLKLRESGDVAFDEVYLALGDVLHKKYNSETVQSLSDIDGNVYSTINTISSYKTKFRLNQELPGEILFVSSGNQGKNQYHALSVRFYAFSS